MKFNEIIKHYKDMSSSYKEGLTLDRIDVNGNYCKENCRRTTRKEQNRNKRNTIYFMGTCLSERSEILGLKYSTLHGYYSSGRTDIIYSLICGDGEI